MTVRFLSRYGLLLAWLMLDGAVAIYLGLYGSNILSTFLLLMGVVVFGVAAASERYRNANLLAPGLVILTVLLALAAVIPYRRGTAVASRRLSAFSPGRSRWTRGRLRPAALADASRVVPVMGPVDGDRSRARLSRGDRVDRRGSPFDVPLIQEAAGQALLRLQDPYLTFVYDSGYPYLPVAAVAAAIGTAFGDARWASVVGDIVGILGIILFARRVGASPRLGLTLAAMAAWWSGGFYVTWQDFTEPILIGFMVLGAAELAAPTSRWLSGGILLGLAAATKQFGLGLLPFLPWQTRSGRRALAAAIVTWLVAVVPFALWHAPEFAEGAFLSHIGSQAASTRSTF